MITYIYYVSNHIFLNITYYLLGDYMKCLFKYLKLIGIFVAIMLVISFLFGLLNLLGLSHKVTTILNTTFMIVLFLVFGIIEGINTSKKGFIAGFKIGLIYLFILLLINVVLFQTPFQLSRVVYYVSLLFSSIFGAMIGINRKKKE